MFYAVVNRKTRKVIASESVMPQDGAYDLELFEVVETEQDMFGKTLPAMTLAEAKRAKSAQIDSLAAIERGKYRTPNMAETYAQKQRDVDAWDNGSHDVPYAIRRAARKNNIGVQDVTDDMVNSVINEYKSAINGLRHIDLDIEDIREDAKERIAAATTIEEVDAIQWPT